MRKADAVVFYGDRIADVLYGWLQYETRSSGSDKNKFLDEYELALEGLRGGWDDPRNFTARKQESHLNRLPFWFEAYKLDPADDYQAARISFAGLMLVSGSYRNQCYIQARDGEDYLKRRQKAIGIPHDMAIKMHLQNLIPAGGELSRAYTDIEALEKNMTATSKVGGAAMRRIVALAESGRGIGEESSPAVTQAKYAQLEWLKFSTEAIILAAKDRGGALSKVPLLEPKSISADPPPEVIYPFS